MKIRPITSDYKFLPSFKEGFTTVYTDFDGTLMPFSHNEICNNKNLKNDENKIKKFNNLFTNLMKFQKMCNTSGNDISLIVTTGRNMPEYKYFVDRVRNFELTFPNPQKVIIRNGGDVFIKSNDYNRDTKKTEEIRRLSHGWDIKEIKNNIINILEDRSLTNGNKLDIFEVPVNKHEYDYEEISLEHILKAKPNKKYYAALADDGELNMSIVFPQTTSISRIAEKIKTYFSECGILADIKINKYDSGIVVPTDNQGLLPAKVIEITPKISENEALSKLYDVKKEVKKNYDEKNNDLVIAAGDGENDIPMLNPLNYLDIAGVEIDKNARWEELLEREDVLKGLKELPFVSIAVGNSPSMESMKWLSARLEEKGIHKIIIQNDSKEGILNKIKKAMLIYSDANKDYKYSLDYDVYKELLET